MEKCPRCGSSKYVETTTDMTPPSRAYCWACCHAFGTLDANHPRNLDNREEKKDKEDK